jgi:hypothetical protein
VIAERGPGVSEAQRPVAQSGGVEGGLHGGERGTRLVPEGAALRGEPKLVGGAVDEAGAEMVLQLAQGARERGLSEVEAGGGAGDVSFVGDGEEGP